MFAGKIGRPQFLFFECAILNLYPISQRLTADTNLHLQHIFKLLLPALIRAEIHIRCGESIFSRE